jgi:VanZ family protein
MLSTFVPAIVWTILIQVLLCLPGSAIPSKGIFSTPQIDKFVHIILFGGFTWLWSYWLYRRGADNLVLLFFIIYIIAAADGIVLEFVQRDYIPNRSFDPVDIIADMSGASIAYGICNIRYLSRAIKKPL